MDAIVIGILFWGGLILVPVLFFLWGNWYYNRPHRVEQRKRDLATAQNRRELERIRARNEERKRRTGYYTKSGQWVKNSEYASWEAVYRRDGNRCHICGKQVNKKDFTRTFEGRFIAGPKYPTVDHVIPQSKGGSHEMDNLRLAHKACNSKKSAKLDYEGEK